MTLYGQGRGGAFIVGTPGMKALLAARPREQKGAAPQEPTPAERREKESQLRNRRMSKTAKGKNTYQPNK